MNRDDIRKMLGLRKDDLHGYLRCIWEGKHLLEYHDMGGGYFCGRCSAGTCVNPDFDLPALPSEPVSDL